MLTPAEFDDAIRKGLGRAVLAVNGPVSQEYEDIILNACQEDRLDNRQLDGPFPSYLMMLAGRAELLEKLSALVLSPVDASFTKQNRYLRIKMIGQFALQADPIALEMLRGLALESDKDSWDVLAKVGDIKWLVHQVLPIMPVELKSRACGWLYDHPDLPEEFSAPLRVAEEEFDMKVRKVKYARPYRVYRSFDEILALIKSENRVEYGLRNIGSVLSENQVLQVANLWLEERDFRRGMNYSRLFEVRDFPLPVESIVDLVKNGDPPIAFEKVLSWCDDPLVRELGLNLISEPNPNYRGYMCLCRSFETKDLGRMLACLDGFLDQSKVDLHMLVMDIRLLVEEWPADKRFPFLQWAYERTPCSECRGYTAKMLIDDGTLPDEYRREMHFDADSYCRELAAAQ